MFVGQLTQEPIASFKTTPHKNEDFNLISHAQKMYRFHFLKMGE
jgi:hypothetical protein